MKRCPQCGSKVDDLAIFCDKCDAVLDAKALLEEEESAPQYPPPVRESFRAATLGARTQSPARGAVPRSVAPVEPPKKVEPPPPFVPKSKQQEVIKRDTADAQFRETLDKMVAAFRYMGQGQRIGLLSALLSFVFSFFPWVSIPQEGSIPGLDVGGFYLVFISIAYFIYLVLDFIGNEYISRFEHYRVLILISLGFLGVLLCTYRIIFPYNIEEGTAMLKSIGLKLDIHRKSGLFLSTLSSIGMFISPFLGGFVRKD